MAHVCMYIPMLLAVCRLLLRFNVDQIETARDCVATKYSSYAYARMDLTHLTYESMDVCTHTHNHSCMYAFMHACIHTYVGMLLVGCRLLLRHNVDQIETATDCVATNYSSKDLIRVGEIDVNVSAFVPLLCFPFGLFHCCLPISIFKLFLQIYVDINE